MNASNESACELKSSHSNSLGLLDVQGIYQWFRLFNLCKNFEVLKSLLLSDLSVDLNSKDPAVNDWPVQSKPPIPAKKKMAVTVGHGQLPNMDNLNDTQNLEVSVVESIKLNESDLKDLEDEFTFDEGSDDEEDEENANKENQLFKRKSNKFEAAARGSKKAGNESVCSDSRVHSDETSAGGNCSTIMKRFEHIGASNLSTDLVSDFLSLFKDITNGY